MSVNNQRHSPLASAVRIRVAFFLAMRYFFKPEADPQLYRSRRGRSCRASRVSMPCAAIPQWRGTRHRCKLCEGICRAQGDLPIRGRPAARMTEPPHRAYDHRHGEMHLLRFVPSASVLLTLSGSPM